MIITAFKSLMNRSELTAELDATGDGGHFSTATLFKNAELELWEWNIADDSVEVTDHQGSLFNLSTGHFLGSSRSFLNRLHSEDRDRVAQQMRLAARGNDPASLSFRMRASDGSFQTLTLSSQLLKNEQGLPWRMVGILHNASSRETSEERLQQQQAALLQWATSPAISQGRVAEGLRLISAGAARILGVERVCIWFFDPLQQHIDCRERYSLSRDQHDSGEPLDCVSYPNYFQALAERQVIASSDARTDPCTEELAASYLVPEGICSKLDVVISRQGDTVGILSFEHQELPRRWQVDERGFAISCADMISMMLEISDRKQAETALSSQQLLMKELMNHSEALVDIKDLNGCYLRVNQQYEDLFGIAQERLLEKTPHVLFPSEIVEQLQNNDRQVLQSNEVLTFEEQLLHQDGLHSYFSVKFPVRDSENQVYAIAGISTDITDRKRTEAALKESELRHRTLFTASLDALLIVDSDGRFIDCNPAAESLLANPQLVGQAIHTLFPEPPDGSQLDSLAERLKYSLSDQPQSLETRCRRRDGSEFDAEINLTPLVLEGARHCLLCIRNISARKQRDELLLNIAKGISAATGASFFRSLLEQLSGVLGADYAFVAQLDPRNPQQVNTLAAFCGSTEIENFSFQLTGTACQAVVEGPVRAFPSQVQQHFPNDRLLRHKRIDGYVGAPLTDFDGSPLGLLVVLFRQPLSDVERCQHLLQIFAVRASAELQRKRNETALVASEERYRAFINHSSEGIWRAELIPPVDICLPVATQVEQIVSNYVILEANQAMAHMHGYSLEELYGCSPEDLFEPNQFRRLMREWIGADYQLSDQESRLLDQRGEPIWLSSSYTGVIENGQLRRIWGTRRNITETKDYLSAIEYQAEHDSLTHLPNRFWLTDRLQQQLEAKRRSNGCLTLMLMDLDHFKEVNDSLGHHTGDQLLRLIGPRLSKLLQQEGGDLARLGGDEFALLFTDVSGSDAEGIAQRISQSLHRPFQLQGIKLEIHCSIGIALYPDHGQEPSELLRCADVAMYLAKNSNRAYARYSADLDEHSPRRLALMSELGQAIRDGQMLLHYQPQLDLKLQRIVGFEALVRWQHPLQGLIPPDQFIHLSEMGDLIRPLTLWVLDQALAQWRRWRDQHHHFKVAVNLSTRNLLDEAFPEQVLRLLKKHGAPADSLELEITESALIADPVRVLASLKAIHEFGVTLSIDDFGTGYSSLAYLKELPIHRLKIDMSFVRNMGRDNRDEMIVNSTINLAHNLGLSVVAEGVEDTQVLASLTAMDCDQVQGYYIGAPMTPEQLALKPPLLLNDD